MFLRRVVIAAWLAAGVLTLSGVAHGQTLSKEELDRQLGQANDLQKKGKWTEAIAAYEKLLLSAESVYGKDSEKTGSMAWGMGFLYRELARYDKAETFYRRALTIREAKLGKDDLQVADVLDSLGVLYRRMSENAKAESAYQRCLQIREKKLGKNHRKVADPVYGLGQIYLAQGQHAKAEQFLQRALQIFEAKRDPDRDIVHTLGALGYLYQKTGQLTKAEPLFQRSLKIREAKFSKNDPAIAWGLNGMAGYYMALGQPEKAEPLYQQAHRVFEAKYAKDHPEVAGALVNLGNVSRDLLQYEKAETFYRRALAARESRNGKDHVLVADMLDTLGTLYRHMGENAKAELAYQRCLQIREKKLTKDDRKVAEPLYGLGQVYIGLGQYAKAESFLQRSLRIYESEREPHRNIVHTLHALAYADQRMGQYAKAEPLFQRSLQIREAKFSADDPMIAWGLTGLAGYYMAVGQFAKAEPLYQRAHRIMEAKHGKDHPDVAGTLGSLAYVSRELADYEKAESYYLRALAIREAKHGKDSALVAYVLHSLGYLYRLMGQTAKAEAAHERCLQIREAKLAKDDPNIAEALHSLAQVYTAQGQYAKAEQFFKRALQTYEARSDVHLDIVHTLVAFGYLYQKMGQYAKAEPMFQRSLQIREAKFGPDDPTVAWGLNGLGHYYMAVGQTAKAEANFQRGYQLLEKRFGKNHPEVAHSLSNLAILYHNTKEYAKAEPLWQRCLEIRLARLGKDHPDVAGALSSLGGEYISLGQFDKASPLLQRALEIREARFGKTHPDVAAVLQGQANIAWAKNDADQAISLLQQTVEIYQARFGKDHPRTCHAVTRLASFLSQSGRSGQAFRTMDRSLRSLRVHTAQVLPILPESEQLAFMEIDFARDFRTAVSMALGPTVSEENRLRSADWILNGKSIMHEALVERVLLARDNQSADAKRALKELDAVRAELSRRNLQGPGDADEASFRKEILALGKKEKALEAKLAAGSLTQRRDPWIDIDVVKQKLPKNAIYVDFLRVAPYDLADRVNQERKTLPPIYAAWISTRDDDTAIVNLGPADKIDAAVRDARAELQKAVDRIKKDGEPAAEKVARKKLAAVSKLVLEPLLPRLQRYDNWVLGPDGNLWLTPWACLPLDKEKYVVEKHAIRCVTSGRDLVLNALQLDFKPSAPAIFADPDFDLAPPLSGKPKKADGNNSGSRTLRDFGTVKRLLGAAYEAEAITPALTKLAGVAPRRFQDEAATVAAFQKLKNPRILVMSTHGYFKPDQDVPRPGRTADNEQPTFIPGMENPLLRSGLLLAGCNQGAKGQQTGVLTGLEIVGTDLRGTELVVLSACETGLGDVRNGEGVAGLRQSFQLAGAQAVVASLWSISDRETAFLMKSFFENISAAKPPVDALREAQLHILRQRRDRQGAAHPFYWAAFTVTGR